MATVATKTFATLVSNFAAAVQARAAVLQDFRKGSLNLAIGQAISGVVLWLQGLVLQLLKSARLSTATGNDVDTFVADFLMTRIGPIAASGPEVFSRVTPSIATVVPIGAVIQSGDGTQNFTVIRDTNNSNYSSAIDGYPLAIGVLSTTATVQAVAGGTQGNVSPGALSVLQTGIVGVDAVSNPIAFNNGRDQETDAALKARFWATIAGLSAGTEAAIKSAIGSIGQGLQVTIGENQNYSGALDNGFVVIIVDDGTGAIPPALVNQAASAADAVRAAGVRYGVSAAVKLLANVTMTVLTAPGFSHPIVVGQVALALTNYIQNLGLGNALPYTRLEAIAYGIPGVTNVINISLNGATLDLAATFKQTIKPGTIAVS